MGSWDNSNANILLFIISGWAFRFQILMKIEDTITNESIHR